MRKYNNEEIMHRSAIQKWKSRGHGKWLLKKQFSHADVVYTKNIF